MSQLTPSDKDPLPSEVKDVSPALVSPEALRAALETLEALIDDRAPLIELSRTDQERLLRAAGLVAHPGRAARKQMVRAERNRRRSAKAVLQQQDEAALDQTAIRAATPQTRRRLGTSPPAPTPEQFPPPAQPPQAGEFIANLQQARNCYICKRDYQAVHFFYDSLCPDCAQFNWQRRNQEADLSGRYALLTGGRVKIGFEAALKLLRCGAHVIVTTRFPADAARRFCEVEGSQAWIDRLQVYGLDLRHTPSVEAFTARLCQELPRLDFIINNACQTIRRPAGYYRHLIEAETSATEHLPAAQSQLLAAYHQLIQSQPINLTSQEHGKATGLSSGTLQAALAGQATAESLAGLTQAAQLSQVALTQDDAELGSEVFPEGEYDVDAQQMDLRGKNSWRLKLAEVSTVEMLEVHLVNAVAPFLLNARLKPLMLQVPTHDKHIVNVSAMEGVFYRAFKRDTHPHTNMAKASMNMMTRTSAVDYIRDGIHMNSVDTGWITDEDPLEITRRKQRERGFRTPLDTIDAAARICNPIINGMLTGEHTWGKFLKDYQVSNW